ncbi:FAD-binding protein [Candidatus Odyssella thessalonicensis]|uniref:FAD-binding protein n=1 Tax=Candidatus Odyssella thessalonicensis TaxID=84647 RepID=UPI000225B1BF|nr:FAD-binding protein [Candidatus Odyssella thessalonicensis]
MAVKRLLVIISSVVTIAYLLTEPTYTPTALNAPPSIGYLPTFIAHKSVITDTSIPNSIEAVEEVLASEVDGLEVDVRLSKDGIAFLYHGEALEEATNGYGKPEDKNWDELKKLHYKQDPSSGLISVETLFSLVGSQKYLFLDIKSDKIFNSTLASTLKDLIHRYHLQETVVLESFNPAFLIQMRLTARDILLMYDFTTDVQAMGEEIQSQFNKIPWFLRQPFIQKQVRRLVRPDILGPRFSLPPDLRQSLIKHGYPLIVWTVDSPQIAQTLLNEGILGIQSNNPLQLMETIQATAQVSHDAGGTSCRPAKILHIKTVQDIKDALQEAKTSQKKITIAGRKHSMGGQALLNDALQLDMMRFNKVTYNPESKTVTVEPGATWRKVQKVLDTHGRSVKVMQSDNIFTVGGSLSVNVHGWQVGSPPLSATVVSLQVMTADGKLQTLTRDDNSLLFNAVLGGYGLFGIIVNVELETVANTSLKFHSKFMPSEDFTEAFDKFISQNPHVELAYGRLSVDQNHLFEEAGLFWFEDDNSKVMTSLKDEALIAIKRSILRVSQESNLGRKIRWSAEKFYAQQISRLGTLSRNNAMNTDIHILWPVHKNSKDILQEYFVPKSQLSAFIKTLKKLIVEHEMNILNVTIREVRQDKLSLLPYAKTDVFGLVCLFSQDLTDEAEEQMHKFTQTTVDEVIKLGGTFYLPYRRHYSKRQLISAYPELTSWTLIKQAFDPENLFESDFYQHIKQSPFF